MAERRETEATPAVTRSRRTSTHTAPAVDRFEKPRKSERVGAHRVVGRPRRFWIYLVSALVGVALLTGAGILAIQITGTNLQNLTEETPAPTKAPPSVQPKLDPAASVVVFNGTPMVNFESIVDQLITENGWGQILFSSPAATTDVQISAVFYSDPADEPAALGLAKELGGVSTFQTNDYDEYGARLVVLLGADYGGPGSDQLVYETPETPAE